MKGLLLKDFYTIKSSIISLLITFMVIGFGISFFVVPQVLIIIATIVLGMLWSSIFVTLMANKIGGLQFGIYRNCQISSRVFHTAVAALPLTKANRSDFE